MFVSVGSASNVAEGLEKLDPSALGKWNAQHALGAAWGFETDRADVLEFTPDGKNGRVFATGIRNCVGLAVSPKDELWCSTNERDGLGDDVPSDYITRVREGAYYGWPWYYLGANEDPRHRGARPDLKDKITVPDVLLQAIPLRSASRFILGSNSRRNTPAISSPPSTALGIAAGGPDTR